jgi:hypothetical protein
MNSPASACASCDFTAYWRRRWSLKLYSTSHVAEPAGLKNALSLILSFRSHFDEAHPQSPADQVRSWQTIPQKAFAPSSSSLSEVAGSSVITNPKDTLRPDKQSVKFSHRTAPVFSSSPHLPSQDPQSGSSGVNHRPGYFTGASRVNCQSRRLRQHCRRCTHHIGKAGRLSNVWIYFSDATDCRG